MSVTYKIEHVIEGGYKEFWCGWSIHLDIRWVTAVAKDVGRDFPEHWNGLGRNMGTLRVLLESSSSGGLPSTRTMSGER